MSNPILSKVNQTHSVPIETVQITPNNVTRLFHSIIGSIIHSFSSLIDGLNRLRVKLAKDIPDAFYKMLNKTLDISHKFFNSSQKSNEIELDDFPSNKPTCAHLPVLPIFEDNADPIQYPIPFFASEIKTSRFAKIKPADVIKTSPNRFNIGQHRLPIVKPEVIQIIPINVTRNFPEILPYEIISTEAQPEIIEYKKEHPRANIPVPKIKEQDFKHMDDLSTSISTRLADAIKAAHEEDALREAESLRKKELRKQQPKW
ncbi:MAG: hypothetical protein JHC93_08825 [Parachlamydiales bacterium]|nr:hypothetical protein [Parachlamydiales bacterium]